MIIGKYNLEISPKHIAKFWLRVTKHENGCWEISKPYNNKGYGFITVNGTLLTTHRFSWAIHKGEISPGVFLCHKCDNRKCVNPDHLFEGTAKDNFDDMIEKGRGKVVGLYCPNPNKKVTDEQVLEIYELYKSGLGTGDIAKRYPINVANVRKIVAGNHYKDLYAKSGMEAFYNPNINKASHAGEFNGFAKLSYDIADSIREKYKAGGTTYAKLAKEYEVSISAIGFIILGWTYNRTDGYRFAKKKEKPLLRPVTR